MPLSLNCKSILAVTLIYIQPFSLFLLMINFLIICFGIISPTIPFDSVAHTSLKLSTSFMDDPTWVRPVHLGKSIFVKSNSNQKYRNRLMCDSCKMNNNRDRINHFTATSIVIEKIIGLEIDSIPIVKRFNIIFMHC